MRVRASEPRDPDSRVHHDASVGTGDHGIQIELGDLGEVFAQPGEAMQQVGKRLLVCGAGCLGSRARATRPSRR